MHYFTESEKIEKGLSTLAIASFESVEEVVANESVLKYNGQNRFRNYWYLKFPYNNDTGLPDIFGEPAIRYGYVTKQKIIRWYPNDKGLKQSSDYFSISVLLKDPTMSNSIVADCIPVLKGKIKYNLMILAHLKEGLVFDHISRDGKYIHVLCHRKKTRRSCKS